MNNFIVQQLTRSDGSSVFDVIGHVEHTSTNRFGPLTTTHRVTINCIGQDAAYTLCRALNSPDIVSGISIEQV